MGLNDPTRPKYHPAIESRHAPMLDSLVALMGHAPDSINVAPYWNARGVTRGSVISVRNPNDQDALLHELGHFWCMKEGPTSMEVADSLKVDPYSGRGAERLADVYSTLLRARGDTTRTPDKDAKLLYRVLARLRAKG